MKPAPSSEIYVGLMSGTSLDGVDIAILDFTEFPPQLLHRSTTPYDAKLRQRLLELCQSQSTTLDALYSLDAELGEIYAGVVHDALTISGLGPRDIAAVGCHGQTIRHSPASAHPYTAQIGDPNRIASMTGITTVADFRRKDIALGGQGAPLAPGFHRFLFQCDEEDRVVINIGGIANITLLPADRDAAVLGFDTGPGNTLLDYWVQRHRNAPFDADGAWARSGQIDGELLERMLAAEPYFQQRPPKSTGTEYFNPDWLHGHLPGNADAAAIQATLVELTARSIAEAIRKLPLLPGNGYLCGGGAHNQYLRERLQLAIPECTLQTTAALGLDADFVEAAAFAWLARERLNLRTGNIPDVTQANQKAILGAVHAADQAT